MRNIALLLQSIVVLSVSGGPAFRLEGPSESVGRYETAEFLIHVPHRYEDPFDPEEVDLSLLVKTPDGQLLTLPCFFSQDYEMRRREGRRKTASWMYPVGLGSWRGRFAPMQLGTYEVSARLTDRRGTRRSSPERLVCVSSTNRGFLRASKRDPRFFEFDSGDPFFAIGQNLAFIGEGQYVTLAKAEDIFSKLSRNGANDLRIWTCCKDWALAVEARKSVWGRSWHWKPPLVSLAEEGTTRTFVRLTSAKGASLSPQPTHAVALRPETTYVFSGKVKTEGAASVEIALGGHEPGRSISSGSSQTWQDFSKRFTTRPGEFWLGRVQFNLKGTGTAYLDALSLREANGGPELFWEADVNRSPLGYYNPVDCFMLDEIVKMAQKHGLYLHLCLLTRDLYMASLKNDKSAVYQKAIDDARKTLRYAVARWGHATSVAAWEYFNENDPGLPCDRFYTELGTYLEQIDVHRHLRATSTWHPSPRDCRHDKLDIADVHFYLRPPDESRLRDEVDAVVNRAAFLRTHAPLKPALIAEFGLANEKWQLRKTVRDSRSLSDFHNAMWASALSGTSGTVLYWWWDHLDRIDVYNQYKPLSAFLAGIPWTMGELVPFTEDIAGGKGQVVGLKGHDCAYVWLFNHDAGWKHVVVEKRLPKRLQGVVLTLHDVSPGTYRVQWWNTRTGAVSKEQKVAVSGDKIRLQCPDFDRDQACKLEKE